MATMNRNANLEEINSDAFMGISYLNYQTFIQKAVLIEGIVCAVGINLLGIFVFSISRNLLLFINLIPLLLGVAFGCNYNEDLSLIQYFRLLISKPSKEYYSKPTEDLEQLHSAAQHIREEEELKKREMDKVSDEEQKKLLIKLGVGAAVVVFIFIIVLVSIKALKTEEVHHEVSMQTIRMRIYEDMRT